jgi:hypothetical protein
MKTAQQLIDIVDSEYELKFPQFESSLKKDFTFYGKTGRVAYCKKYETYAIFVYPNVKNPIDFYEIDDVYTYEQLTNWVLHLSEKTWFCLDIQRDFIECFQHFYGGAK